jgi:hypothetical protein
MPIVRGHHSFDDHFTQIPNAWLRDSRLSLKSIGLLAQLMSHSPGWNMSIRSIARANGTGSGTVKTAVLELEHCGYLRRGDKQKQNPDGTFADYEWTTQDPFQNPVTVKPRHGEIEHKEEQEPIEEQFIKNNKRTTAQNELLFNEFWKEYPKKLDKAKAKRAFRSSLTRATFEDILAGVIKYKNDPNRIDEYTKYPATWLNADAWENGPLPYDARAQKKREAAEQEKIMKEWGQIESE